jgi:hypothetical protein
LKALFFLFLISRFFFSELSFYADVFKSEVTRIYATSTLPDQENVFYGEYQRNIRYSPDKILDGDPSTAWSEGKGGPGKGEYITIVLSSYITIDAVEVMPGYFQKKLYKKYNRVKTLTLAPKIGSAVSLNFEDVMESQFKGLNEPIKFKEVKISINDIYAGDKWDDTCIAEIKFYRNGKAIELTYNRRIVYKNGSYILPNFKELRLEDVIGLALNYYLKADHTLYGGAGNGSGEGMTIVNGTWVYNPSDCSFHVNYSYYTFHLEYGEDGNSETIKSEVKNTSCTLYVLEVDVVYQCSSECIDVDEGILMP